VARPGLLAVLGSAGPFAAHEMLAGTLLMGRGSPLSPGVGLRRGSVVVLEPGERPDPGPGFAAAASLRPVFLRLVLLRLQALGFPLPAGALDALYGVFLGDLLEGGRGEILYRAA
jgi:formylmethanofuran dehydrogenase subunit C